MKLRAQKIVLDTFTMMGQYTMANWKLAIVTSSFLQEADAESLLICVMQYENTAEIGLMISLKDKKL